MAGEGVRLWRGARSNCVWCAMWSLCCEVGSLCLGPQCISWCENKCLGLSSSSYLFIHSTLPDHLLCVGHCAEQKEYVVSRADIAIVFIS